MATRREQREALRRERQEREQALADSRRRKRLVGFGVLAVVVVGAVVALALVLTGGTGGGGPLADANAYPEDGSVPAPRETELRPAARAAGCALRTSQSEGNDHVQPPVTYRSNPPHSGDHLEIPAEDQAYTDPPQTEALVHSLEHGRIIVQFRPGTSADVRGALKALYDEDPYHVIVTPNGTSMPYAVAATAWRQVLACDQANARTYDAIRAFRDAHRDRGPEDVP